MFDSKTVFVIGAGASKEAGLPIGAELTRKIANLLRFETEYMGGLKQGDPDIFKALVQLTRNDQEWKNNNLLISGNEIAEAMIMAQSIDTFLQTHQSNREFVLLGKLGIVRAIVEAERASKLALREMGQSRDISRLANTWYFALARLLFNGVPANAPHRAFENVTFIVFNYDRCLQTFLVRAVEIFFRIDNAAAVALIANVKFIHPYGSLGDVLGGQAGFGPERLDLMTAANSIKTFSEPSDARPEITKTIFEAEKIIFLGFGFHEQNMEILDISEHLMPDAMNSKQIFATTHGLSDSDEEVVRNQISYAFNGSPQNAETRQLISTRNVTCADFFGAYWRSLSA